MILSRDDAQALAYKWSVDGDRFVHVKEEFLGQTRWGVVTRTIFINKEDGKFYAFDWEQGATESQDYDDFDYDGKSEFEAHEVRKVEVTVTEFHKV